MSQGSPKTATAALFLLACCSILIVLPVEGSAASPAGTAYSMPPHPPDACGKPQKAADSAVPRIAVRVELCGGREAEIARPTKRWGPQVDPEG